MRKALVHVVAIAAMFVAPQVAGAQIRNVDPDQSWRQPANGQQRGGQQDVQSYEPNPVPTPLPTDSLPQSDGVPTDSMNSPQVPGGTDPWTPLESQPDAGEPATPGFDGQTAQRSAVPGETVPRDDVFTAAENLFGRGAAGLGGILEDILRDQGEPVAYIAGQEAAGAFILGARWGSGVMHHRTLGDQTVYWRGPSIGFDAGADASKVFVLVYNLNDPQMIFRRYIGGEGRAYFVGGFTATYLRRGDTVLIPVRLGVGLRLGANIGCMRFSQRNRWFPSC